MLTFLLILVLVFVAVDLFVRLVIEPLAAKKNLVKKEKKVRPRIIEPSIGFVGATMYDGGKEKKEGDNKTDKLSDGQLKGETK